MFEWKKQNHFFYCSPLPWRNVGGMLGKNYRKEIRMLDVDLQQVVKGCIPCLCSSASNQPSKCVFNSVKFVFKRERFSSLGLGHSPAVRRETPV